MKIFNKDILKDYGVLDYETTGLDPNKGAEVVCVVEKKFKTPAKTVYKYPKFDFNELMLDYKVLVAHNAKFDLKFMWKSKKFQKWLKSGGLVWDTDLAEYLLSGQYTNRKVRGNLSLNSLAKKYFNEEKIDVVYRDYYSKGIMSQYVPKDLLLEYCIKDGLLTEKLYQHQVKRAIKLNMLPIISTYMRHLLVCTSMEFEGVYFDCEGIDKYKSYLEDELLQIKQQLDEYVKPLWNLPIEFNYGSGDHLSYIIFGGNLLNTEKEFIYNEDGTVAVYGPKAQKAGQPKTKNVPKMYTNKGQTRPRKEWETKKEGIYATNVDVLEELNTPLTNLLLKYRGLDKIKNTYTDSLKQLVSRFTNKIHPTFNLSLTSTGRLSSKSPNFQNFSPHILQFFKPENDEYIAAEIDFSQLEIVIQAWLSQSDKFIKMVERDTDFHCLRLSYAEELPYKEVVKLCDEDKEWKDKRKLAKIISFQKAYGAHYKKLAAQTGLPEDTVKKIFDAEDEQFPEVKQFSEDIEEHLSRTAINTNLPLSYRVKRSGKMETDENQYHTVGLWQSITGKRYAFQDFCTLTMKGEYYRYFKPTQIKNYPIQGTAGDLVAHQVGKLFEYALQSEGKLKIVNEIHDAVWLLIKKDEKDLIFNKCCDILTDMKEFEETFGVKFNVPLKVDGKMGSNFGECK